MAMLMMCYLYHFRPITDQGQRNILYAALLQQLYIEEELNRKGVTKAERQVLNQLLQYVVAVVKKHALEQRYY